MRKFKIPAIKQQNQREWGTLEFSLLLVIVILVSGITLAETPVAVSYDLKVTIEPNPGEISVRGNIRVPIDAGAKSQQFEAQTSESFILRDRGRNALV